MGERGGGQSVRSADNLTTLMRWLSIYLAASTSWNPQGLPRPVQGLLFLQWARDSDLLWAGQFGDWFPVKARICVPIQTGTGTHPAIYTLGTESVLGTRWPGSGNDHPPSSSAKLKERVELYLYFPSGPSCPVPGWMLPLPFTQWVMTNRVIPHQRRPFPT